MKIELTKAEIESLRKEQKDPGLHRRRYIKVTVILMLYQGYSVEMISLALGIDDNTVYRYEKGYRERGLKRYLNDGYIPCVGKLTEQEQEELKAHLDEQLYSDSKEIIEWIKDKYGKSYSTSGVVELLHRLGYSYKKTKLVPGKADKEAQAKFVEELDQIIEEVDVGQAELYYCDGVHPTHNPRPAHAWIKKGKTAEIKANTGRKRVNVNGAINAFDPEQACIDIADSINAQSTQRLCQQLLNAKPNKTIYLICDNARYYKNRMLQDWLEDKPIKLIFLPPYSPNLNLIERLWKYMKRKILDNRYYPDFDDFRKAIIQFFKDLPQYRSDLISLLTLNFQLIGN